jgi:small-conductance mechanosensitive channel
MDLDWNTVKAALDDAWVVRALRAGVILAVGLVLARVVSRGALRTLGERLAPQQRMLFRRAVFYGVLALALLSAIHALGVDMTVFLGAAGVLSVALAFASQTSASNLISGLFLIAERPFVLGDVIQVGDTTGEVLSIDMLSVRLRTFDNLFVRVPNETIVKSQIINLTRFPIRRLDLEVPVAYGTDLERVREVLMQVAEREPLCLEEPAPLFIVRGFQDSAILLQFSVWFSRPSILLVRNAVHLGILRAFEEAGIEIPLPQHDLRPRTTGEALEVRLVEGRPEQN